MALLDLFEEMKALTAALDAGGQAYALCGALAVGIHGAPRATKDVDLLVAPESVESIKAIAKACGFVLEALPMRFKATDTTEHRLSKIVDGALLTLDLLLANESTRPILEARERLDVEGGSVWVVSRQGLISMKLAAGRTQDLFDLERLQAEEN